MIKHCNKCQHVERKVGIAGGLWCSKKSKLCSIARKTSEGNDDPKKDCFVERIEVTEK